MLPKPIDSLSNLSCLAKKNSVNPILIKTFFGNKSSQRTTTAVKETGKTNSITKGKIQIKPSEYPQSEPSTEASSTTQATLNQTVTTLTKAPQIRNQKSQNLKKDYQQSNQTKIKTHLNNL